MLRANICQKDITKGFELVTKTINHEASKKEDAIRSLMSILLLCCRNIIMGCWSLDDAKASLVMHSLKESKVQKCTLCRALNRVGRYFGI